MRAFLLGLTIVVAPSMPVQHAPAVIQSAAPAITRDAAVPALERVVVLGASVSDGFGLDQELGVRTVLADVIEATLKTAHEPVLSKASGFLFMDPLKAGREEVDGALAKKPTLVVGIDFLFWFGYGKVANEEDRPARFEKGLALLEGFTCPMLLGDLPDMSQALAGESSLTHRPMLRRSQIPAPEMLKQFNERLAAWSAKHPNVVVVPIGSLLGRLHGGQELSLRGNAWPKDAASKLFQKDLLHPTLQGAITVWLFALDTLVHAQPAFPASAFEWDVKAITKKIDAAKEIERQAKAEAELKVKADASNKAKERVKPPQPAPSPEDQRGKDPVPH